MTPLRLSCSLTPQASWLPSVCSSLRLHQELVTLILSLEPCVHSVVESEGVSDSVVMFARKSGYIRLGLYLQSARNRCRMASLRCDLPSCDVCENISVMVNSSESEVLQFRFGVEVKILCGPHYQDQFTRYQGWHSRKCSDPYSKHCKKSQNFVFIIFFFLLTKNFKIFNLFWVFLNF